MTTKARVVVAGTLPAAGLDLLRARFDVEAGGDRPRGRVAAGARRLAPRRSWPVRASRWTAICSTSAGPVPEGRLQLRRGSRQHRPRRRAGSRRSRHQHAGCPVQRDGGARRRANAGDWRDASPRATRSSAGSSGRDRIRERIPGDVSWPAPPSGSSASGASPAAWPSCCGGSRWRFSSRPARTAPRRPAPNGESCPIYSPPPTSSASTCRSRRRPDT